MSGARGGLAALIWTAVRFGVVGLSSIAVYFVILWALRPVITPIAVLAAVAYLGSMVYNYVVQARVTFRTSAADGGTVVRYLGMHGLCLAINSAGMYVLVERMGSGVWLSQLAVTVIVAGISFALSYLWVYPGSKSPG